MKHLEQKVLSTSWDLFNDKIKRLIDEAVNFCKTGDIRSLAEASRKVGELTMLDPKNNNIGRLKKV
jgi:hypothetical protein